jgi:DNA-binding GntR family transcriptional regulator
MDRVRKADAAYHQIERMIVFRDIDPGSLVSETFLMEQTGMGRTPVREALQRLARDRMVEIHPNKGVLVPPISIEAQLRMLELRRVLEGLAVRLGSHRADRSDRAGMQQMVDRLGHERFTLMAYAGTVRDTHDLIIAGAHNEYLAETMAPLQGLSRRFWYTHVVDEETEIKTGADLHVAILQAILARDPDAAEAASHDLNSYLVNFAYAALRRDDRSGSTP